MRSYRFSNFRDFLENENQAIIKSMLDNYIMFFKKDGEVFGASENSRIIFANMKNPSDDLPKGWHDEASFAAVNLTRGVHGEPSQCVFSHKDLKKIHVIDEDKAMQELLKQSKEKDNHISNQVHIVLGKDEDKS